MKADKLKWHRRKNREAMCRGSLAWLGRQTHNHGVTAIHDEISGDKGAKRSIPEVAGSNPVPGTNNFSFSRWNYPTTIKVFRKTIKLLPLCGLLFRIHFILVNPIYVYFDFEPERGYLFITSLETLLSQITASFLPNMKMICFR